MFDSFGVRLRSSVVGVATVIAAAAMTGTAAAQTTVVLNQGGSQVTDTTLRGGAYANTNYDGNPLITRRSWSRSGRTATPPGGRSPA